MFHSLTCTRYDFPSSIRGVQRIPNQPKTYIYCCWEAAPLQVCIYTYSFHFVFKYENSKWMSRFCPQDPNDMTQADKSGNCPAGMVVDQAITHPVDFDYYLLSHGGLIGTSRPAHYSVRLSFSVDVPDTGLICHGFEWKKKGHSWCKVHFHVSILFLGDLTYCIGK